MAINMSSKQKIASCIRCDHVFCVRDPLTPRGSRCPHILHCGHAICEHCLTTSLQIDASVACTKCAKQSLQKMGMKNLNKEFPIHLYVLGQFMERHRSRMPQDSKITFVPPTSPSSLSRTVSNVSVNILGAQSLPCDECPQNAEWSCENCPANYCTPCFAKVHAAARSLKNHVRAPIRSQASPSCEEHSDQKKDFYCNTCNEIICPCCAIGSHSGHSVITRAQMNEEQVDNVHAAVMVASAVLAEIAKSQQERFPCCAFKENARAPLQKEGLPTALSWAPGGWRSSGRRCATRCVRWSSSCRRGTRPFSLYGEKWTFECG